jgi:excisionase family DNA binding protein
MNTQAQSLFTKYKTLSSNEQLAFRALMHEENLTHEEVFGHLKNKEFSSHDSCDYLGVSVPTFRRYISRGLIKAHSTLGRNHLYSLEDLRDLKQKLRSK